jgi:predicted RNase H-like HicB family nuclease
MEMKTGIPACPYQSGHFSEPRKSFMVSDGQLTLNLVKLEPGEPNRYGVTSPIEPELLTEADSIGEAFSMAEDALVGLRESRKEYSAQLRNLASAAS